MNLEDLALRFLLLPESRSLYERVAMIRPIPALFHYTTSAGLKGILESGRIWATEARYLNDTEELVYSERVIRETLLAERHNVESDYRPWLEAAAQRVASGVLSAVRFFVASFCERGDLLSQWRGYASAGHCLQVAGSAFVALPGVHVVRVIYDGDEQKTIIRQTLKIHLTALEAARDTGSQERINHVSGNFGAQIALYISVFKNPSFFEEREWRLIAGDDVYDVKHRGEANNIPYVELPLLTRHGTTGQLIPILKVINAPQCVSPSIVQVGDLLDRLGYDRSLVIPSSIPLRV